MSRTTLNFLLDTALLVAFTTLATLAVVLQFVFPPATLADGWTLWGRGYDHWSSVWFNMLAVFAVLVLVHVMLHWSWVCGVAAQRLSKWRGKSVRIDEASQTVYGVGLLIALFLVGGIVVTLASFAVREPKSSSVFEQKGRVGGAFIKQLSRRTKSLFYSTWDV